MDLFNGRYLRNEIIKIWRRRNQMRLQFPKNPHKLLILLISILIIIFLVTFLKYSNYDVHLIFYDSLVGIPVFQILAIYLVLLVLITCILDFNSKYIKYKPILHIIIILLFSTCLWFSLKIVSSGIVIFDSLWHMGAAKYIEMTGSIPTNIGEYYYLNHLQWPAVFILSLSIVKVTGMDWIVFTKYFPVILGAILVILVYITSSKILKNSNAALISTIFFIIGYPGIETHVSPRFLGTLLLIVFIYFLFSKSHIHKILSIFIFFIIVITHMPTGGLLILFLIYFLLLNELNTKNLSFLDKIKIKLPKTKEITTISRNYIFLAIVVFISFLIYYASFGFQMGVTILQRTTNILIDPFSMTPYIIGAERIPQIIVNLFRFNYYSILILGLIGSAYILKYYKVSRSEINKINLILYFLFGLAMTKIFPFFLGGYLSVERSYMFYSLFSALIIGFIYVRNVNYRRLVILFMIPIGLSALFLNFGALAMQTTSNADLNTFQFVSSDGQIDNETLIDVFIPNRFLFFNQNDPLITRSIIAKDLTDIWSPYIKKPIKKTYYMQSETEISYYEYRNHYDIIEKLRSLELRLNEDKNSSKIYSNNFNSVYFCKGKVK